MTTTAAQAEKALLGAIILSRGRALDELTINPADYQAPLHESMHRAAQALHERGEAVDEITLQAETKKHITGPWEPAYVHQVTAETPSAATAGYYAGIVTRAAAHRKTRAISAALTQLAEQEADPDLISSQGIEQLEALTRTAEQQPVQFVGETIQTTIDALDEPPRYTATPWPSLNDRIGGLRPGALYTIGARPGIGKTIIGLELAMALSDHGSVAFVSMEMGGDELQRRAMANLGRIEANHLENSTLTSEDRERIKQIRPVLDAMPMAVLDKKATIEQIRHFASRTHRRRPLAGVVVDYLQLIETPPGDKRPRHEFIASVSRQLKLMARELDVPVIALSQLNRESANSEDRMPRLSQMRESGAIEQDSDVVILLHKDESTPWELQLLVAKNRRGTCGPMTLDLQGYYYSVSDPRGTA